MSGTNGIGSLTGAPGATPLVTASSPPSAAGKEQQVKTASLAGATGTKGTGAVDETSISSTSELLSAALSGSDVRLDKVLPLQQAIANGTYNVPSPDVAEKLIDSLVS